jgi:murein DD-endopeptidase MepM/ murein hydrolase activator NlpD
VTEIILRAWLVIAVVLLLNHASALAGSYIQVLDKGVVYYYFSNQNQLRHSFAHPSVPAKPKTGATPPEAQVFIQKMDELHNLRPLAIRAVIRMEANHISEPASPKDVPGLEQLRLNKTDDLPIVNSYDPTENIWIGPRYLGRFAAKSGYRSPLASSAPDPDSRRINQQQALPPIQEIRAAVKDACNNFLKYALEQPPLLTLVKPGADPLAKWSHFGYCFPVAPPFSLKDTWGDPRSEGRYHYGVDIFAYEGTPVYAITSGVIHQLANGSEAGIYLLLRGQDGRGYGYMHLQGYAEGIAEGKTVKRGELIGYVGRTGILRSSAHLHLQLYFDHCFSRDKLLNPYELLVQLCNGKGVTDLWDWKTARRQIPGTEVANNGILRISNFVPRRYQGGQRSDTSKLFKNN